MSELEHQLKALEANVAEQFGDEESSVDEEDDSSDMAGTVEHEVADDDELYLDSLYCVACNKTFKSERA